MIERRIIETAVLLGAALLTYLREGRGKEEVNQLVWNLLSSLRSFEYSHSKQDYFLEGAVPPRKGLFVHDEKTIKLAADYHLSDREVYILSYLLAGRNPAYISQQLSITKATVKSHRYAIYRKTDVHSLQELLDLYESI